MTNLGLRPTVLALVLLGVTTLLGCETTAETTAVESVHDRYLREWTSQRYRYHEQYWQRKAAIKQNEDQVVRHVTSAPDHEKWTVLVDGVFRVGGEIEKSYETAGRWQALKAFIEHMRSRPDPGMTNGWFVRQVEELRARATSVDQETRAFADQFEEKRRLGTDWIPEVEAIFSWRGYVVGYHKELQALYRQAVGYFGDVQRAEHADYRRAQQQAQTARALLAAGMYLNQMQYQQQLLNTLNRPRTCTSFGNTVTCQ